MAAALDGLVALVTGASSGIGEATARAFAAEGATVVAAARRRERLDELAASAPPPGRIVAAPVDITEQGAPSELVAATVADHGRLDILVNNAGVMLLGPVVDAPLDDWRRMIELNLLGLLSCTHAALPHLLEAASGPRGVADLVNVSSVAGRVARNGSAVYNATKFAVGAFSEGLRQEVTRRHVRVTLVEPGVVATELAGHNRPEILDQMARNFAGVEPLRSEDIAASICFAVTRPGRAAINEILVRPTDQER